jgi:hypothetical protein
VHPVVLLRCDQHCRRPAILGDELDVSQVPAVASQRAGQPLVVALLPARRNASRQARVQPVNIPSEGESG